MFTFISTTRRTGFLSRIQSSFHTLLAFGCIAVLPPSVMVFLELRLRIIYLKDKTDTDTDNTELCSCRGESLTAAVKSMDNEKINRSCLESLLHIVNERRFTEVMDKVKQFHKESPTVQLKDTEQLVLNLSQIRGLKVSLKLWSIRHDCEAIEREICKPLNAIMASIRLLKNSKELGQVLGVTLKVINLMKGQQFPAIKIQELYKLETIKDNTKTNSLLYHIVRKVLQEDPKFEGFPHDVLMKLNLMADTSLASLDEKIAIMESGYRFNSQTNLSFMSKDLFIPGILLVS